VGVPRQTVVSHAMPQLSIDAKLNAFMTLFLREQRRLYQFVVTLLANTVDADDVFQETSLAIWSAFDEYKPGTDFYSWAKQIAYHRALRHWRQNRRSLQYLAPDVLELIAGGASADGVEPSADALVDCVKSLSVSDRHLIQRCYIDNASGQEMAEELQRPVNSVYKSLGRIRRALMACVQCAIAQQQHQGEQS
jgi:RNA polymerase sigma-70 factor (ECF subfamily)